METPVRYIGIAGLMPEHVWRLADSYEKLIASQEVENPPQLFLGLQTSRKKLDGLEIDPVYADRMNSLEQIEAAISAAEEFPHSRIVVHYNPGGGYDHHETDRHLEALMAMAIDGLQWNGLDLDNLPRMLCSEWSAQHITILQVQPNPYLDNASFAEFIADSPLQDFASHLLFDASGGTGRLLDVTSAAGWIAALHEAGGLLGIAISGGLGPETLERVSGVRAQLEFQPDLSIDAEGKLRDELGFSVTLATEYLRKALILIK